MPLISIIMPAYGVERYISHAIESILLQTSNEWELIVVDDGSKDRSKEIAEEYAKQDGRISVVSKENGGLSSARNYGLKYAKGEYVTFFDSDDYAKLYFLENLISGIGEEKPDVIIGGYEVEYVNEDGSTFIITRNCPDDGKFVGPFGSESQQYVNYAWNKLFRREFLKKNNLLYEEGLYRIEDAEFMSRLIDYSPKISFVRQIGYVYVQRPIATLSNVFDENLITHSLRRVRIDAKVLRFFNPNLTKDEDDLVQYLKQGLSHALLSRIYRQKLGRKVRHNILRQVKEKLLPKEIIKRSNSLSSTIKYLTLQFLSKGQFNLVDLIYKLSSLK